MEVDLLEDRLDLLFGGLGLCRLLDLLFILLCKEKHIRERHERRRRVNAEEGGKEERKGERRWKGKIAIPAATAGFGGFLAVAGLSASFSSLMRCLSALAFASNNRIFA